MPFHPSELGTCVDHSTQFVQNRRDVDLRCAWSCAVVFAFLPCGSVFHCAVVSLLYLTSACHGSLNFPSLVFCPSSFSVPLRSLCSFAFILQFLLLFSSIMILVDSFSSSFGDTQIPFGCHFSFASHFPSHGSFPCFLVWLFILHTFPTFSTRETCR